MQKAEILIRMAKQFAYNFTPTFRACDIINIVHHPTERTEFKYVLKYHPFKKYKNLLNVDRGSPTPITTNSNDEMLIKSELQREFATGTTKFNDTQVLDKISDELSYAPRPSVSQANIHIDDEDSNETKMNKLRQLADRAPEEAAYLEQLMQDETTYNKEKYRTLMKVRISQERGNQLEKIIIDKINQEDRLNFIQDKQLKVQDFGYFRLCGVADGLDEARNMLIEVKTRKFMMPNKETIALRDKLQCLCYMKLYSCKYCLLVESGPDGKLNKYQINWDEDEFETRIYERLKNFVLKYRNIKESEFKIKLRRLGNKNR